MNKHIFVTYSARDRQVADLVLRHLEEAGECVWIAPRNVPLGMSYPHAIVAAIRDCRLAVLILSEHSNVSPHVLREVERISSDNVPLFVLKIDPVELSDGLSYFARLLQWVEAPRAELESDPRAFLAPILHPDLAPPSGLSDSRSMQAEWRRPPSDAPTSPDVSSAISFSELAEKQRRMLAAFGLAVLDFVCQQSNPSLPIPRRELFDQLRDVAPDVFDGLTFRQFCSLLNDARDGGCAPGLSETAEGVFVVEENIAVKRERNRDAKAAIARHAASLIRSGMLIALDGGSTTLPIAEHICDRFEEGDLEELKVVTNSLAIAETLSRLMSSQGWTDETARLELFLAGGRVRANTHATAWCNESMSESGLLASLACFGRPIDLGFIGGNGIEFSAGVTMGSDAELGFKRFVLRHAGSTYVVADSSKAGITLPVTIARWDEPFSVLMNELPPPAVQNLEELIMAGRIVEVSR